MKFEGYYVKCSSEAENIAVIFGASFSKENSESFIQIITGDASYYVNFEYGKYCSAKSQFGVKVENNYVDEKGMFLDINKDDLIVKGYIKFEEFMPIEYDAMGPFKFLPFMECRHIVVSMRHNIFGEIIINGKSYNFDGGLGYIEGDKGKSFPSKYLWSQAHSDDVSIFCSSAIIPYLKLKFNGTICIANVGGIEYRLATYLGAKVLEFEKNRLVVVQGVGKNRMMLEVDVLEDKNSQSLLAPTLGRMDRIIKESLEYTVSYQLTKGEETVFSFINKDAAFEYFQK